jgi:hypothetical protein
LTPAGLPGSTSGNSRCGGSSVGNGSRDNSGSGGSISKNNWVLLVVLALVVVVVVVVVGGIACGISDFNKIRGQNRLNYI